jgi:hypothetical protein
MVLIGIDIGLTGAVSAIKPNGDVEIWDVVRSPNDKARLCAKSMTAKLAEFHAFSDDGKVELVVENVRARAFGNGGKEKTNSMHSQASMIGSRRIVEAACDMLGLQPRFIEPQTWKKFYGLIGKDKNESRRVAAALYPAVAPLLQRVKDDNRAEALLLAHWGLRRLA